VKLNFKPLLLRCHHRHFFVALLCLAVVGCGSNVFYLPVHVDPKTDMYSTTSEVNKSAILEYDTSVDPRKFRFVALYASSNAYPGRFEFFIRNALAELGIKQVLNQGELEALVKAQPKLKDIPWIGDHLALKRVSDTVGPILMIECNSTSSGSAWRYVTLKISDVSTGRTLLHIEQHKMVWTSVDSEALYPVLNVLRQWFKASTNRKPV